MDSLNSLKEAFTAYRLKHPARTAALAVGLVSAFLLARRGRSRRPRSTTGAILHFTAVTFIAAGVVCAIAVAAGVYLIPRGYRWIQYRRGVV